MRNAAKQREARDATGRKLNKPLPTGSMRTLSVERSQRAFARMARSFGRGDEEAPGNKASVMEPLEGQETSGRDVV